MHSVLMAAIAGVLITITEGIVSRVLLALGMGLVVYSGVNAGFTYFGNLFSSSVGSLGYGLPGLLGVLKIDMVLSIYTAAGLARLAIAGAQSGTVKRLVVK